MSSTLVFYVVRCGDGEILRALIDIVGLAQLPRPLEISFRPHGGEEIKLPTEGLKENPVTQSILKLNGRTISSFSIRSGQHHALSISREIHTTPPGNSPNLFDPVTLYRLPEQKTEVFLAFSELAQSRFRTVGNHDFGSLLGPDIQRHFAAREEAISRLEALASQLLEKSAARQLELEQQFERQRSANDAHLDNRRSELASRYCQLSCCELIV